VTVKSTEHADSCPSTLRDKKRENMQLCLKEEKVNPGLLRKTRFHLNPQCTKYFVKNFGIWSPLLMELVDSGKKEFRRNRRESMGQETET